MTSFAGVIGSFLVRNSPALGRSPTAASEWRTRQICRHFQSTSDFELWRKAIQHSAIQLMPESLQPMDLQDAAPFLYSVSPMADHLQLAGGCSTSIASTPPAGKTPRDSLLQCTYPLRDDALLRNSITDFSNWSSFRLGKFYETVDALTADVAYRHCSGVVVGEDDPVVTFVTAGHYHSRKFQRTNIHENVVLRSYVTSVGTSSIEVRTDALQVDHNHTGKEILVNVCHTVMVALDPATGKSLSKVGRSIPSLIIETPDDQHRLELAQQHNQIRRERAAHIMQLRATVSAPPTMEEMRSLHQLHQARALYPNQDHCIVKDYTFRSSTVIFPENRNVHGKLFGGFVMEEAQTLAQYAATFLAKGRPIIPLGIDEAIFLQPIAIGDMVTFTARIVHATTCTCRVLVLVEVRDPAHRDTNPARTNRLMFVFGGSNFPSSIIPETYSEILMSIDAQRRHDVEGPTEEEVQRILKESSTGEEDFI